MELYEFDRRDGLVVRVVVDNAGAAWFVAVDVFEALNVRNTRRALSDLDSDLLSSAQGVRDLHRRLGGSQLPALALVSGGSL